MSATTNVATRILVLSDTHSALPDPVNKPDLRFSHKLPEADVAIHCGDLTSCGKIHEHERAVALLKSLPAPIKIVIPGNHDMTLDSDYLQQNRYLHGWGRPHNIKDSRDVVALYTSIEAREAGIRYLVEGLHSLNLPNGAKLTIYASAFTPEFCNWGFAHSRSYDRFNATKGQVPDNPVPAFTHGDTTDESLSDQVTVMVTHGPPRGILDKTVHGESVGCDHLLTAVSRCRPLLHCFGHIHEAWGAETRLWSGAAEHGGVLSSEVKESRTPDVSIHRAQERSDHSGDSNQVRTRSEVNLDMIADTSHRAGAKATTSKVLIAHPTKSLSVDEIRVDSDIQNVSVIDARSVEHGKETVFLNASIMDIRYVPSQWPWLVHMKLPKASEVEIERS